MHLLNMRWVTSLALCTVVIGCGIAAQPESAKTVAAFEVPLPSEADRMEFLSALRAAAREEGLHVDAARNQDLQGEAKVMPQAESTLRAAVWRGKDDDEAIASAMDQPDHLGQIWIMFSKGNDPKLNGRFQQRAMDAIMRRWPETLSLPIMPTGAIPLHRDLIKTSNGYVVDPTQAHKYEVKEARQ
jgi:hypothetical protein